MSSERVLSRAPSREGLSGVYLAGSSYTSLETKEAKDDFKVMLYNYNKYDELLLKHYNLKKWATISCILGLFFIWAFLNLSINPR